MKKQGKKPVVGIAPNHPEFEFGVKRRIVGNLNLPNFTILTKEFWYIMREGLNELYVPDKQLFTESRHLLEQGKTLASAKIGTDGQFILEWKDSPMLREQPWMEEIYLVDESYNPTMNLPPLSNYPQVTAYRILTLHWLDNVSSEEAMWRPVEKSLVPAPIIVFYGSECEKDVGQLK